VIHIRRFVGGEGSRRRGDALGPQDRAGRSRPAVDVTWTDSMTANGPANQVDVVGG